MKRMLLIGALAVLTLALDLRAQDARGVVDAAALAAGKIAVIAPEGFMEEATSENVMAGSAMMRRAAYQFATGMTPGPQGQMGSGIGMAVSGGKRTPGVCPRRSSTTRRGSSWKRTWGRFPRPRWRRSFRAR